ncbi:hypothetical protein ACH4TP_37930 [Streptomyces sp. NPDC021012]|uniref:hypothetical protein n=1 Tax=Streptomyces sp. NPDC021012 TaxID=3365107 RepID=UPI0037AB5373
MTVLTTTRTAQPLAIHSTLLPHQQDVFDTCMDHADNALDALTYNRAMEIAAKAIEIDLPPSGSLIKCACTDCYCPAIFDPAAPGLRRVEPSGPYNLPRLQCAPCADAHPAPHED